LPFGLQAAKAGGVYTVVLPPALRAQRTISRIVEAVVSDTGESRKPDEQDLIRVELIYRPVTANPGDLQ
jgi:hypothetical protein